MMNGLFIIVIVLVVLWLINQHSRNFEPFESYEEKKVELSLCDLVTLFKKLILSFMMNEKQKMYDLPMDLKQIHNAQSMDSSQNQFQTFDSSQNQFQALDSSQNQIPLRTLDLEPQIQTLDLEPQMPVENGNMNIINNVEPNDDELSNQSLFQPLSRFEFRF